MTYEEALQFLEEAIAHQARLTDNDDPDEVYLVNAQVKQFEALVKAFEKFPDK